jgi:Flp pilus assembly protein CpaB
LIVAVIAGLIAAGSIVLLVTSLSSPPSTQSPPTVATSPTTKVVVTSADLKPGDQLTAANVALADFPTAALPLDGAGLYFTDVSKLLNPVQYTSSKLPRGTLILATLLVAQPVGPAVAQPPLDIQNAGDVAIAVPFDETKGAGGFVQTEDRLDILVDDNTGSVQYAFQDVRVIKVGGRAEQTATGSANLLLVELPREQAAVLAYLEDRGFDIRYVIRPYDEFGKGPLPDSAPVNGSNWTTFLAR